MKFAYAALSIIAVAGTAPAAEAAVVSYGSLAAFTGATNGVSTATFEGVSGSTYVGGSPVTGPGYSITASDAYLFQNDPSYTTYYYDWGTGDSLTFKKNGVVTVSFSTAVTAFALELGTFRQDNYPQPPIYGDPVTIGTSQGNFTVPTGQRPNLTFFGVTSDTAFTSFTITNPLSFTVFDNLRIGTANVTAAVPEPATWAMMIGGFGMIGGAMRRRPAREAALA